MSRFCSPGRASNAPKVSFSAGHAPRQAGDKIPSSTTIVITRPNVNGQAALVARPSSCRVPPGGFRGHPGGGVQALGVEHHEAGAGIRPLISRTCHRSRS